MSALKCAVRIDYTNWRGKRRVREIVPEILVWEEGDKWHLEPQWILYAYDEDGNRKGFAMKNIHSWV